MNADRREKTDKHRLCSAFLPGEVKEKENKMTKTNTTIPALGEKNAPMRKPKRIYMIATDRSGALSAWVEAGAWNVP